MMLALLMLPIVLQGICMAVDEFYFHHRRGLPLWERVGHPLDTVSVLVCYGWALAMPPIPSHLGIFAALAALSCLLITKDEFVHARHCGPTEQWLHAVLFVLHPLVLGAAALLWWFERDDILVLQTGLIATFGIYQIIYWNWIWPRQHTHAQ